MDRRKRAQKIAVYGAAYQELVDALAQFPVEMWQYRSSPDDWTIHEIIIHITDSEANSYVRARRLLAEPGKEIMAYDEMGWAVGLDYHMINPVTSIELFRWLRQSTFEIIQDLSDEKWEHRGFHPEIGEYSLEMWLDIYARHIRDHIEQMQKVYDMWLENG